jgi:hypothetical protein
MIYRLIIEAVASIAIIGYYVFAWRNVQPRPLVEPEKKDLSLSALNNAIGGGLVAVSILLPISLAVATELVGKGVISGAFDHIKIACFFFTASLLFAIWNLFRIPQLVQMDMDLAYDKHTIICELLQFYFMLLAVFRLVSVFFELSTPVAAP